MVQPKDQIGRADKHVPRDPTDLVMSRAVHARRGIIQPIIKTRETISLVDGEQPQHVGRLEEVSPPAPGEVALEAVGVVPRLSAGADINGVLVWGERARGHAPSSRAGLEG